MKFKKKIAFAFAFNKKVSIINGNIINDLFLFYAFKNNYLDKKVYKCFYLSSTNNVFTIEF